MRADTMRRTAAATRRAAVGQLLLVLALAVCCAAADAATAADALADIQPDARGAADAEGGGQGAVDAHGPAGAPAAEKAPAPREETTEIQRLRAALAPIKERVEAAWEANHRRAVPLREADKDVLMKAVHADGALALAASKILRCTTEPELCVTAIVEALKAPDLAEKEWTSALWSLEGIDEWLHLDATAKAEFYDWLQTVCTDYCAWAVQNERSPDRMILLLKEDWARCRARLERGPAMFIGLLARPEPAIRKEVIAILRMWTRWATEADVMMIIHAPIWSDEATASTADELLRVLTHKAPTAGTPVGEYGASWRGWWQRNAGFDMADAAMGYIESGKAVGNFREPDGDPGEPLVASWQITSVLLNESFGLQRRRNRLFERVLAYIAADKSCETKEALIAVTGSLVDREDYRELPNLLRRVQEAFLKVAADSTEGVDVRLRAVEELWKRKVAWDRAESEKGLRPIIQNERESWRIRLLSVRALGKESWNKPYVVETIQSMVRRELARPVEEREGPLLRGAQGILAGCPNRDEALYAQLKKVVEDILRREGQP